MAKQFKINGITFKPNSNFKVNYEPVHGDGSGRNLSATMDLKIIDWKFTISASFTMMSDTAISSLMKQLTANEFMQVTYPSPLVGKEDTRTFYVSSLDIDHKVMTESDVNFWDISFKLIEQ